jgi:hypothetical protein
VAVVAAKALAEESVDIADDAIAVREQLTAAFRVRQNQPVTRRAPKLPRQRERRREVSRA